MKIKLRILVLIGLFFSCLNEVEDNRPDWIKEIDMTIRNYNDKEEIVKTRMIPEVSGKTIINLYKKDSNGLYKVKRSIIDINNAIDFAQVFYLRNDKIILDKMYGLLPLLYKHQKKETDPSFQVFERVNYYKNRLEFKQYIKEISLMDKDDKESFMKNLNNVEFKEVDSEYISYKYLNSKETVGELKKQLLN